MTTPISRVRVVVADDHPIFREGVSRALTMSGEVSVVAEVDSGRAALDAVHEHQPDVLLLDYRLPDLDGLAVLHALVRDAVTTKVVMLSANSESATVFRALEEGATGYLSKDSSRAQIVAAVTSAAKGKVTVSPELAGALAGEIRGRADRSGPTLSERELQVLAGMARGRSLPQIASELFLGTSTVKTHAQRLYEKLEVSDRAAAVAEAMRRGLLE